MQYYYAVKCSKAGPECSSIKQYKKPQCNRARVIDAEAHRHHHRHLLPYLQLSFEKLCRNLHPYYNYLFKVIVMELCTGGSLFNLLDDPENSYGLDEVRSFEARN